MGTKILSHDLHFDITFKLGVDGRGRKHTVTFEFAERTYGGEGLYSMPAGTYWCLRATFYIDGQPNPVRSRELGWSLWPDRDSMMKHYRVFSRKVIDTGPRL